MFIKKGILKKHFTIFLFLHSLLLFCCQPFPDIFPPAGTPDPVERYSWEETKLQAADHAINKEFGRSVSMAADGKTLLVGAEGVAFSYKWNTVLENWEENKITASDGTKSVSFGSSVALSADGCMALIGDPATDAEVIKAGAAYVYRWDHSQSNWLGTKLEAGDGIVDGEFGKSVSLAANGDTALIGAPFNNGLVNSAGAAYIFYCDDTRQLWEQNKLAASDGEEGDGFGCSVSLTANGKRALIGAHYRDEYAYHSGAAYIYSRNSSTNLWQEEKQPVFETMQETEFGYNVSISAKGDAALIGAWKDSDSFACQGAVYIFRWNKNTNDWQKQRLIAREAAFYNLFGRSVCMSADGNSALISSAFSKGDALSGCGAVYFYKWDAAGNICEETELQAFDQRQDALFGSSAALSADGHCAVIGAPGDEEREGAVYIYQYKKE